MSDDPQNETPKVIIPVESLFGKKTEQVTVDSNRLNPISESDQHWLDSLAIPARPCDILLQACTWLSAATFTSGFLNKARLPSEWVTGAFLLGSVFVFAGLYAWIQFPRLRLFIAYRIILVAVGALLGVTL